MENGNSNSRCRFPIYTRSIDAKVRVVVMRTSELAIKSQQTNPVKSFALLCLCNPSIHPFICTAIDAVEVNARLSTSIQWKSHLMFYVSNISLQQNRKHRECQKNPPGHDNAGQVFGGRDKHTLEIDGHKQ